MKKLAVLTLLMVLSALVLSQPSSAFSWPSNEIKNSCPKLARAVLPDGTLAYYGCGERKNDTEISTKPVAAVVTNQESAAALKTQLDKLALVGFTEGEILETLAKKFTTARYSEDVNYQETDLIFSEVRATLEKVAFPIKDKWPYHQMDHRIRSVVEDLSRTSGIGPRYGRQIMDIFKSLTDQYSENDLLLEALRDSIRGRINGYYTQEEHKQTGEERKFFLPKLLEFHQKYQDVYIYLPDDDFEDYTRIDGTIAMELRRLKMSR